MNWIVPFFLSVSAFVSSSPVTAATLKDVDACSQQANLDLTLSGCRRVIADRTIARDIKAIAYNNIGNAWILIGDYTKAIDACAEGVKSDPSIVGPYLCLGVAHRWRGEFEQAIKAADAGLLKHPRSGYLRMSRATSLFEKGDFAAALADADAGVRLEPKLADAHIVRARILAKTDSLDTAIVAASDAIRAEPKYSPAYVARGDLWRQKGNLENALADQNKAVALLPSQAENYIGRGTVERYMGDYSKAVADFKRALQIIDQHPAALTGLGLTFEKMNDPAQAKRQFELALNSTSQVRTGPALEAIETAKVRLAALNAGVQPPVIPAAPTVAANAHSVPAPPVKIPEAAARAESQGRRVALVIGNSSYNNVSALANPQHDAEAIAQSLKAVGFDKVELVLNATREQMISAFRRFGDTAENASWAMVYYAGHGLEVNGTNYLIPVDAKLATDRDIQFEAVPIDDAMISLEAARSLKLVVLDACRNNPFAPQMRRTTVAPSLAVQTVSAGPATGRSIGRGLAEVKVGTGTLVVYSAKHGEEALDGDGDNSPFAVALVQRIATPNVEINKVFRLVRDDVMEATAGRQEPFTYGSLPGKQDFFFLLKP